MNPAFSVIVFSTLSGAGYGLLAWLGLVVAVSGADLYGRQNAGLVLGFAPTAIAMLCVGMALATIGLVSSMFHLGKPARAWRAFSQWRTSWLSREGVLAVATFVPALALVASFAWRLLAPDAPTGFDAWIPWLGGTLAVLALATVCCTAMIYASLKPVPAWRHGFVVPVYLAFALLTGNLLVTPLAMFPWTHPVEGAYYVVVSIGFIAVPLLLVIALSAMKQVYWRDIDRIELPTREAATALEGFGKVATFERPHTEANYLTREMGFVVARKHARKLRTIALALFALVPMLALLATLALPSFALPLLSAAALSALAGAFVERWLFFAEAKHLVTLYY